MRDNAKMGDAVIFESFGDSKSVDFGKVVDGGTEVEGQKYSDQLFHDVA